MKVIYSGGYDKYVLDSFKNNFLFRHSKLIRDYLSKGKKVIFVCASKPTGYYKNIIVAATGTNDV